MAAPVSGVGSDHVNRFLEIPPRTFRGYVTWAQNGTGCKVTLQGEHFSFIFDNSKRTRFEGCQKKKWGCKVRCQIAKEKSVVLHSNIYIHIFEHLGHRVTVW